VDFGRSRSVFAVNVMSTNWVSTKDFKVVVGDVADAQSPLNAVCADYLVGTGSGYVKFTCEDTVSGRYLYVINGPHAANALILSDVTVDAFNYAANASLMLPWWVVDFEVERAVSGLVIQAQTASVIQVRVGHSTDPLQNAVCRDNVTIATAGSNTVNCSNAMLGRYIFVIGAGNKVLVLNDVRVLGFPAAQCAAGTYKPLVGNHNCTVCPAFSTSIVGATSVTACTCLPGYINIASNGAPVNCSACPANTYYVEGACITCPSNSSSGTASFSCQCNAGFTGNPGACQACPAGTYKRMSGTSACRSCQSNSRSDSASALCSCNMGYTGNTGDVCVACVTGMYKDVIGPAACTSCAAHRNSPVGSIDLINCTCNQGYTHDMSKVNLARSCGPNAACETVYGGISGSNAMYVSSVLTDGDIDTLSDGVGLSSWIRIDFGRNISMDTIVLWNGNLWNHNYWWNYYAFDVRVFMSASASFDGQAVQCIGPVPELWWTREQLQAGSVYQKRSRTLKCVDDSTISGRYLYLTYSPGTHTWISFGEIQVYVSTLDAQRLLISNQLTYQQPCAMCDVGKFKGTSGTQPCTTCGLNQSAVSASIICSCVAGFTGPDGGPCAECTVGRYKDWIGSQACTACPANSNTPFTRNTRLSNCTCNIGYTGPDGGPCFARGHRRNSRSLCASCGEINISLREGAWSVLGQWYC
jgi:hypothetical protein